MKVIISTLNSKYIHSSLALRYLQAYGRTQGEAYDIVEYTVNMPILDILNQITTLDADVIGFACYIWNIDMTLHLCEMIKSVKPNMIIVLGGPEVSYTAEEILRENPFLDGIVQGEGEEAFTQLIQFIKEGKDLKDIVIPGILYQEEGRIYGSHEVVEVKDLSTIPFPYTEEDMTTLGNKIIYYESSRGCPFSCQYCLSGNKNTVRFFPLERTLQELEWFVSHHVKQVKFVDRTFNCNPKHHLPLMRWMRDNGGNTNFHLEMESILMGSEEVEILSSTKKGQIQIEVGVQSTYDKTLAAIHRRNDWNRIQQVIPPIIEAGKTHVHMDLIVGLPHESKERFAQSFNDLFSLQPHALQIGFLKLLKGSGVRRMKEYEYIANPKAPYEVLQNHVMTYEEIRLLKYFEDVFERFYNSERYRTVFSYISQSLMRDGSAFSYFEVMTKEWLSQQLHERKLNDADQIAFLYEFFLSMQDDIACDLLRYDVLLSFGGKIRDERFGLGKDRKTELQESEVFWRNEALVQRFIEGYQFVEWRRIRQDYYELQVHKKTLSYLDILGEKDASYDDLPSGEDNQLITLIIDTKERIKPFIRPTIKEEVS